MPDLEMYLTERENDVAFIAIPSEDEKTGRVQDNTAYALAHTHVPALVAALKVVAQHRPNIEVSRCTCGVCLAWREADRLARAAREKRGA